MLLALAFGPHRMDTNLPMPLSIATFFPSGDLARTALLSSISIFSLLYVALLAAGPAVVCRIGKVKALTLVLIVWSVSVILNVGVLAILGEEFHFLP